MHTALVSVSTRLAALRALAWAQLFSGWFVLGGLGEAFMPTWAGGLGPIALWLASAGLCLHFGRTMLISAVHLRGVVAIAGFVAAVAVISTDASGGSPAVMVAAVSWGVLLVASSRAVRMLRSQSRRVPPPVVPGIAGAAFSWFLAGDPTLRPGLGMAVFLVASSTLVAALLPRDGSGRGCRAGLFDCALPLGSWSQWRDPTVWPAQTARWAMLPMMATVSAMTRWCGSEWGLSAAHAVGLHLAAMLLPPLGLQILRVRISTASGVALAMVTGLGALLWLPGMKGLLVASTFHSLAWGLVWYSGVSGAVRAQPSEASSTWIGAITPALCVLVLGALVATSGPSALRCVHVGLGLMATAGFMAAIWRSSPFNLEKRS